MRRPRSTPALRHAMTGAVMLASLGLTASATAQGSIISMPLPAPSRGAAPVSAVALCDHHGGVAESALQLPSGLLRAIGRVESGRRDPETGRVAPWPWTINANGQGRYFADAASAAQAVRELRAAGTTSIDVGCFQVNLFHHPQAFQTLEEAFDPATNATYAAAYLAGLRQKLGGWDQAVAAYHSATPERGEPYRERVYAAWNQRSAPPPDAAPARSGPLVFRFAGPEPHGPDVEVRVWTPSRAGSAPSQVEMPKIHRGTLPEASVQLPAAVVVPLNRAEHDPRSTMKSDVR